MALMKLYSDERRADGGRRGRRQRSRKSAWLTWGLPPTLTWGLPPTLTWGLPPLLQEIRVLVTKDPLQNKYLIAEYHKYEFNEMQNRHMRQLFCDEL
jgi:hypothetical protein